MEAEDWETHLKEGRAPRSEVAATVLVTEKETSPAKDQQERVKCDLQVLFPSAR